MKRIHSDLPWGTITGVINVVAGVLTALSMGALTMAGALPAEVSPRVGAAMSVGGLVAAAMASGLLAVGRGLWAIGQKPLPPIDEDHMQESASPLPLNRMGL